MNLSELNLTPNELARMHDIMEGGELNIKKALKKATRPKKAIDQIPNVRPQGEGVFDVAASPKTIVQSYKKGTVYRDGFPPSGRKFLKEHGDVKVVRAKVGRRPIQKAIQKIVDKVQPNSPFDKYFHLYIKFELLNGKVIMMDKTESLNIKEQQWDNWEAETSPVNLHGSQVPGVHSEGRNGHTLNSITEKTKKLMGRKFASYNATKNNCQDFIMGIVKANKFIVDESFVKQDVDGLFSDFFSSMSGVVTGIASKLNVLMHGGEIETHPLSSVEIDRYYAGFKKYKGTIMHRDVPDRMPKESAYVINLDKGMKGTHWVAVVNHDGKCTYFDSYGVVPPPKIKKMMKRSCRDCYFNNSQLQDFGTVTCGYYCIYYIDKILKEDKGEVDTLYTLTQTPSAFNEKTVAKFVKL